MKIFRSLFRFKKKEIASARANATRCANIPGLKLLRAPSTSTALAHGKLLIIIPRATGTAVKRNRLRRQIRAIYYQEKLYENPVVSILIVYKEAVQLSFDEIKKFLCSNLG